MAQESVSLDVNSLIKKAALDVSKQLRATEKGTILGPNPYLRHDERTL